MRKGCEVASWIDLQKALDDGVPFYTSQNQVILTPGKEGRLSPKYFLKARDLFTNEDLGWQAALGAPVHDIDSSRGHPATDNFLLF